MSTPLMNKYNNAWELSLLGVEPTCIPDLIVTMQFIKADLITKKYNVLMCKFVYKIR